MRKKHLTIIIIIIKEINLMIIKINFKIKMLEIINLLINLKIIMENLIIIITIMEVKNLITIKTKCKEDLINLIKI